MIDEIVERLVDMRGALFRRLPYFEFLDPRVGCIRTEAGRQARISFLNLYEGDRAVSWSCFVDFLKNAGRLQSVDRLVDEWAKWQLQYDFVQPPSEQFRNHMRGVFESDRGPCEDNLMDPAFGAWFDFAGYLMQRARPIIAENERRRRDGTRDNQTGRLLLRATKGRSRRSSSISEDEDEL